MKNHNPPTKSAILVNSQGRPTEHHFVRCDPVIVTVRDERADGTIKSRAVSAAALVYVCIETAAERHWGVM